MTLDRRNSLYAIFVLIALGMVLQGCEQKSNKTNTQNPIKQQDVLSKEYQPITVKHTLGTTVIKSHPQKVVAFDMNDIDILDQLGVPIAGMTKDYVPHFLVKYKNDPNIRDLGAIVQPNLERVHALQPDLILISPLQARSYNELSQIAPTLHFDVDLLNESGDYINIVRGHVIILGQIFEKEEIAHQKVAEIDAKIDEARLVTEGRSEKALIVMHNNGAYSSFGIKSRYGFIFDTLGVKPASTYMEPGLHGQPISNEFINEANPDILYVLDRTAVMEHGEMLNTKTMENPLLRQTKAWKNGKVIFVDAQTWYISAASVTSLKIIIDEVITGYQN